MRETSGESNFIKHWVRIRIEGFKPERLLSQAMEKGIEIRKLHYRDETEVLLTVAGEDLKILKGLAKSKYRITVCREGGVKPAVIRIKGGKLAIAGIGLFCLILFAQLFFVREVNIIGCKTITETSLRACLAEEGLYEGALKRFDCEAIERRLFQEFDTIVWARVAYEGNYVQVEIRENEQYIADGGSEKKPCDIVAERDCYIEEILAYTGKSVASKDEFVKKGDILISGTILIENPSYQLSEEDPKEHYVHAAGRITARVPYYFTFYMEPDQEKTQAETLLRGWIQENIPENAQILNKDFHFDKKKNIIRVYGTIETRQEVGEEKEIVIDKSKRRTEENSD